MAQKSFKFRLQTILNYKQDIEDQEKEKLAKILAELEQAISYKHHLEMQKDQARLELREKQKAGGIDVGSLRFYTNYLKKIDNDIIEATLNIERIRFREKEQRQALLKAAQDRQAYEKLKEKHKEEFEAEEAEKERKLIDELATIKFARKQMEEQQMQEAFERGEISEEDL